MSSYRVQEQVSQRIADTRPKLVILSPPCTKFSTLQELNIAVHGPEWEKEFFIEKEKAIEHIDYCMGLARTQMERGDYFRFEHPAHATSRELETVEKMMREPGVSDTVANQCMYGLVTPNAYRTELVPAKKPKIFMSNSWYVLGELSTRCDRSHAHQPLMGGQASKAQE